jgi:hypothetical protein
MAAPAPKPPAGNHTDTADILAAIRDLGDRMERRFSQVEADIAKLDERQRKQGEDVSELKGRVSMLPTTVQLAGLIFAIFGASFVLIRFASGH